MSWNIWRMSYCSVRIFLALLVIASAAAGAIAGQLPAPGWQAVCRTVDRVAGADRLPEAFLTRVLWQESRLHSDALSPKGAEGVAQFMPPTATEHGLADPWSPGPAIAAAGRLLADLRLRFGNLGLAAAAYNAGAGRVEKWLRGKSELPVETRAYVRIVTGRAIEDWLPASVADGREPPDPADCVATVAALPRGGSAGWPATSRPELLGRVLAHALALAESQGR
jgi:hypothetical protein